MDFDSTLLAREIPIRLGSFLIVFGLMATWEVLAPRRRLQHPKAVRWANNLGLVALNSIVLRVLFPAAAAGVAAYVQTRGGGLIDYVGLAGIPAIVVAFIALDLFIYLQHVMMHALPMLWRLHRVHHADLDYDVTTGARFHTLEILLSMLLKFSVIVLLGPPVIAVILFEVVLNATSMFNHANVRMPAGLDRVLRWFVVTPDMHRVHHSADDDETNSNFGFNLPWWDRLFGTYRAQPRAGHEDMRIGIRGFTEEKWCAWLPGMLAIPFVGRVRDYAINRRNWDGGGES